MPSPPGPPRPAAARRAASSSPPAAEVKDRPFHADMMRSSDVWTEEAATQDAVVRRSSYEGPVPSAVLSSSDVTRDDLMQMCDKRAITYGEADSIAALKASLIKFNQSHNVL